MGQNKRHSQAFQDQACKLVTEQGYTQKQAAEQLGIHLGTLRNWLKKRGLVESPAVVEPDYLASDDPKLLKARIAELEKQLRRTETEREILKKATAYFANLKP